MIFVCGSWRGGAGVRETEKRTLNSPFVSSGFTVTLVLDSLNICTLRIAHRIEKINGFY